MSGRTFRRTMVLTLALSAGLLSVSNAHAARVQVDRKPVIRQESSVRTSVGNAWDFLWSLFSDKEAYGPPNHPGNAPNHPGNSPKPEGPGLCPLGKPGDPKPPGNGN